MSGIFREYGENAGPIASPERSSDGAKQASGQQLASWSAIEESVPARRGRIHPATRVFQALRIAVNNELDNLKAFLGQAPGCSLPEAGFCIISFHSLEDRIVKEHFRQWAQASGKESPPFRILTRKPRVPSYEEVVRTRRLAAPN
jgi:16S rRNA (cytosine1402-N4)-methyltransferase